MSAAPRSLVPAGPSFGSLPVRPSLVALGYAAQKIRRRERRRRIARLACASIVTAAIVGAWMVTLRPQSLGGPTGYVMIQGVSMNPMYHTGDLVLVRPSETYGRGDIVAYRVPTGEVGAGLVIIHRITGGSEATGFTIQGDNTSAPDEWHPGRQDIIGKAWLHVPRLGKIFGFLHAPLPLASLAAAVTVTMLLMPSKDSHGERAVRSRSHRKREKRGTRWGTSIRGSSSS